MEIKVLKNIIASKNELGNECFEYLEGNIYNIYEELAQVFIKENWGIEVNNNLEELKEKAIKEYENKAINNLENKQFKSKK
jgi:hypothetical protein